MPSWIPAVLVATLPEIPKMGLEVIMPKLPMAHASYDAGKYPPSKTGRWARLNHHTNRMEALLMSTHALSTTLLAGLGAMLILGGGAGMAATGRRGGTRTGARPPTGAVIGSFSGSAGSGALIGAGVGAVGGYLYDQDQKKKGY